MATTGQAPLKDVWKMLDACAQGWQVKEYTHNYCVMFGGRTYPSLPRQKQVDAGHIKHMIRQLRIDVACAREHLKILQG